ncbi:MAG TPA: CBS domain-containing protein [Nitrospirales bacterium]|jgi:tRNA nucleotidyltransferase (CCA-adding enzyme)|nr:CBS domain-containing protein [Nitrospirales bacterium]
MEVIATHLNADFDGLASMVAAKKLYPEAALVLPGGAQETVRDFLAVHDLGLTRLKEIDLEQVTRVILVDTQEPERTGPLKGLFAKPAVQVHIYDHHPEADQHTVDAAPVRADLRIVEPVGATTTIMIEQLKAHHVSLTPFEATVLALGLYEETGSLAYTSTTPRDLYAAADVLRYGADLTMVSDVLRSHLDPDQIALLNDLLHSSETYYLEGRKILLATSTYDRYRGDLAEVVHKLADMEGLDAVVSAIAMKDKIEIIGRSRRPEIDVGQVAREFGGGGHAVAASASVKGQTLVEVKERLAQLLTERYRPTLLAKDVMTTPVKAISADATVTDAESSMTKYGVNVLPVLDSRERYLGLVTREIIQKALFHQFHKTPVLNLIQADAYTATSEMPFREIENRMIELNQRFVPILAGPKVIGVITRTDLLRTLHDDVLLAARARARGQSPPSEQSPFRRNIKGLLRERLPDRIFAVLERAGELAERTDVSAFVVGGFVRDLLLGRPNLDLDLVIEGDGITYARELGAKVKATVKTHERFGTAVLIFPDGFKLDVATARTEYYEYPTALPTVERSSIKKDLYRRDFTINTLAIRLNAGRFGDLIDFYGGQHDLKEKTLRVLHSLSFVEDPTRVFRAIRFEQRFGFRLGKETLTLIRGAAKMDLFHRLSGSRLLEELILLFSEEESRKAIARLAELDLLRFIHPNLKWSPRLEALLKAVEGALDWYKLLYLDHKMDAWVVHFMALMEVVPDKAVREVLKRLPVPERQAEKIRTGRFASQAMLRRLAKRPSLKPAETYRTLLGLSDEVLLFLMAKTKLESVKRQISACLTTYQHMKASLTGSDLKAMGLQPGPLYKKILDRLLDARLNGEVKTEADERALAKKIAKL